MHIVHISFVFDLGIIRACFSLSLSINAALSNNVYIRRRRQHSKDYLFLNSRIPDDHDNLSPQAVRVPTSLPQLDGSVFAAGAVEFAVG